ncbi:zinc finger protein 707 isoform X2 [Dasypus novemcinctus]|nr:zinc finger protein 707 isoform X2 [Dasypus novemcinctus]
MLDTFGSLAALGFCGPRPDLIFRLEQWDDPWVEDWERPAFQEVQRGCPPGALRREVKPVCGGEANWEDSELHRTTQRGGPWAARGLEGAVVGRAGNQKTLCSWPAQTHWEVRVQDRATGEMGFGRDFLLNSGDVRFLGAAPEGHGESHVGFQWRVCGKRLEQQPRRAGGQVLPGALGRQVPRCHSQLAAHQTVHSGRKAFECLECGQTFRWVSNLLRHQRNHTSEKPFSCDACGQAFSLKDRLAQHRKVHTEHKPYPCGDCGKAFKQKSNLLRHRLVHTGERPFCCPDCGKAFRTKENLTHHRRIHSGEKPYTCAECGKAFRWPKGFSIHQRLHSARRSYECGRCGKGFRHLGFFTRHQRTHRRGKV